MINGIITNKEIWANKALIVKEFGLVVFGRCVWAAVTNKKTTFLELIS